MLTIYLHRTNVEEEPKLNFIPKNLTKVFALDGLKFIRTRLQYPLSTTLVVVENSFRKIYFGDCILIGHDHVNYDSDSSLEIVVGTNYFPTNDSLDVSFVAVLLENSIIQKSHLLFESFIRLSLSHIVIRNTIFEDSAVAKFLQLGVFGFNFENCTFSAPSEIDTPGGIHLFKTAYLIVKDSEISIFTRNQSGSKCLSGCAIKVEGFVGYPLEETRIIIEAKDVIDYPTTLVQNTKFFGSHAHLSGGSVNVRNMNLILRNCSMILTNNSKPPSIGGLIFYESFYPYSEFEIDDVILNACQWKFQSVSLMTILLMSARIRRLNILCPPSLKAEIEKTQFSLHFSCIKSCPAGYTFEANSMMVMVEAHFEMFEQIITLNTTGVLCFACPVGANCTDQIKAFPNYWGYRNKSDFVTMIRCPDGYCCQDHETCKVIDSCNVGRKGPLCAICKTNYSESFFTSKCISNEECHDYLILFLYFVSVMVYGTILTIGENVKNKFKITLQKLLKWIKNKATDNDTKQLKHIKSEENTTFNNVAVKDVSSSPNIEMAKNESESSMKYIQILFYYVQDASLFKVHLPDDGQSSESVIVQVIQFSPEVLASLLTKAMDMCFSHGPSAVTKVLFKTFFGPSVILFILLIYVVQRFFTIENCPRIKSLKFMMLRAFLLALLFSFQKIVTGAFVLVQCVDVDYDKVLYIQGSIQCYMWWQIIIHVLIFTNIIPLVLVFSVGPFYVKNKMMSVRLFILACIFPVPVWVYCVVSRILKNQNIQQEEDEIISGYEESNSEFVAQTFDSDSSKKEFDYRDLAQKPKPYTGPSNVDLPFIDDSEGDNSVVIHIVDDISVGSQSGSFTSAKSENFQSNSNTPISYEKSKEKYFKSAEAISHTLLEHYKTLNVCGIYFTWLGIHKFYRVALVACNTYITEPLQRLWIMTAILIVLTVLITFVKPYKEQRANQTAIISYAANLCIAIINV